MSDISNSQTIIILGMHRSGTSTLAGSLEAGGLFLGDTNHASIDNAKGNRESRLIMALHDDLLARNGGSWDKPVQNLKWDPVHRALRDAIIGSYIHQPLWGFKDPRSLFSLQGWLSVLPEAKLIGIFRHPYFVAESLFKRNGIAHDEGLALWTIYNRVLLWLHSNLENATFPIIEFSENEAEFFSQIDEVTQQLKLSSKTNSFFDTSLRQLKCPDLSSFQNAKPALHHYHQLQTLRVVQ